MASFRLGRDNADRHGGTRQHMESIGLGPVWPKIRSGRHRSLLTALVPRTLRLRDKYHQVSVGRKRVLFVCPLTLLLLTSLCWAQYACEAVAPPSSLRRSNAVAHSTFFRASPKPSRPLSSTMTALSVNTGATYGTAEPAKLMNFDASPRRRLSQWYTNMFMINFVEFAAESSRGVVLATLFLYTKSLGGDLAFMGMLTSLFSVGRLISSTVFGWMCDHYSFRSVYLVSSGICLVGNIIYLIADQHVTGSLTALAASRFIVGFGAGNRSVCRADVASITTINQRLPYLTLLATVVFLGYALTPGLGSLVANTDSYLLGVHFNKFTSPGMILIVFNLLTIIGMVTVYDESVGVHDGPLESPRAAATSNTLSDPTAMPERIVNIGAAVFIFLNFNARGILSVFETVNIPLFIEATDSDPESVSAVVAASNFQFYLGLLGLLSYFSIEHFRHSLRDVSWVQLGFATLLAGNVLLIVAPTQLSFPQLAVAEFLVWSVGCPITTAVVLAAFSKLLGGRPQGTLMGLLGSAASISRIVLPLLPAAIPTLSPVFWINIVLCASSMALLWWYSTLVHKTKMAMLADVENAFRIVSPPNDPRSPLGSDKADFPDK